MGRELFFKIYQLINLSFLFQKWKDTISSFHFCLETIFKNWLGSRDTTRNITVKKSLFFKNLKKL